MPEIPTYGDQRVRSDIRPAPTLNPRIINADSYGAGVAQATAGALSAVAKVHEDERQKAIKVDVFNAANELDISDTKLSVDFRATHGTNTFDSASKVDEDRRKKVAEISARLTSPEAKEAFGRHAANTGVDLNRTVQEHLARERKKFASDTYDTSANLTVQSAVSNRNRVMLDANGNPTNEIDGHIHASLLKLEGVELARAESEGTLNSPAFRARNEANRAAVWHGVIEADIAARDYESADRRMRENGEHVPEPARSKMKTAIADGKIRDAGGLLAGKSLKPTDGVSPTMSEALAIAKEENDPAIRDSAISIIKSEFADRALAKETDDRASFEQWSRVLEGNGGNMEAIPLDKFNELDERWRVALLAKAQSLGPQGNQTEKTRENVREANNLRDIIDSGYAKLKNDAIVKVDKSFVFSMAAANGLTATQTEDALKYFDEKGKVGHFSSAMLNEAFRTVKGDSGANFRKSNPELFDQVTARLPPGEEVTEQTLKPIIAQLLVEGEVFDGGAYNKDMTYSKALSVGSGDKWLPDVPAEQELPLAEEMNKMLYPVNEVTMRRFLKYGVQGRPTPMKNGKPMTPREAILEGIEGEVTPDQLPKHGKDKEPSFERGAGGWRYMYPNYIR